MDAADSATRSKVLKQVKTACHVGRAAIEQQLLKDGSGTACARRLSDLEDDLVQSAFAFATEQVFPSPKGAGSKMAVVAVGGYGRGTLAPGSDIDLLFLSAGRVDQHVRKIVEYVLYLLWDMDFKVGHATRTVDECITLSRSDMTIRTAILEARYLTGNKVLCDELIARFDAEVVKGTAAEFVAAKLAERDERHEKQGSSRYLVEPNIKEGKGGLRDLQTLFWIAKYVYRTGSTDELVKAGVFSRSELRRFLKAEDFLWAIRCHLHFMTGREEDRLSFDHQQAMAQRLGYNDHPGLADVERFMKHYFLVAKDVGDLTRIFCAELEEIHVKQAPGLNRLLRPKRRKRQKLTGDFILDNDRINFSDDEALDRDPVNIIRIFHLIDRENRALHPEATQTIRRRLKLIDGSLRKDPEANRLFLEILSSPRQPEATLRAMNETGVLGRFIPEFGKIVAMMQFSMYHHFTVDEHLLRAIGELSQIEQGVLAKQHPLIAAILPTIAQRVPLYVAVLLHDIAKGRPEDHSIAGGKVARRLGPRFGLSPEEVDTVVWLVENHLVMSEIAQRRDLQDPKTIHDFVAIVQDIERLRLLLVLTVVDIRAVGPGVWNGWKGQLLRTLYWEAEPLLTGGHSQLSRENRVKVAKEELVEALKDWPAKERDRYIARLYPAYLLRVDVPHKLTHAELLREVDQSGERMATSVTLLPFEAVTEITIIAPDHPRLLSIIAGACAAGGANIVDAQIFTTVDGLALDTVFISREFDLDEDERRRAERICGFIEEALAGKIRLPDRIASRHQLRASYKAFKVDTRIRIDNTWSNKYTAIEASGLDRPGLLYELTRALSDLNLNIGSAHITTYGERAVDVFYVSDLTGAKITSSARETTIRKRLGAIFDPDGAGAKKRGK